MCTYQLGAAAMNFKEPELDDHSGDKAQVKFGYRHLSALKCDLTRTSTSYCIRFEFMHQQLKTT